MGSSSSLSKYETESKILESNILNNFNYIQLIFTLQPNTLEGTKLLTITLKDYTETLTEDQLQKIVKFIFISLKEYLNKLSPLSKNTESIIIEANINLVYDFWANWRFEQMGIGLMTNILTALFY